MLVNTIVLSRMSPYCSSQLINCSLCSNSSLKLVVQNITYVFEIIPILSHTNTYHPDFHLTYASLIAYYLLFIPQ